MLLAIIAAELGLVVLLLLGLLGSEVYATIQFRKAQSVPQLPGLGSGGLRFLDLSGAMPKAPVPEGEKGEVPETPQGQYL
jgi:hypothetical protein